MLSSAGQATDNARRRGSKPRRTAQVIGGRDGPLSAAEEHELRQRVLQDTATVTRSIATAVVLKEGDLFLLTEPDGCVPLTESHGLGLYYHDCRYLNGYELTLAEARPDVLVSTTAQVTIEDSDLLFDEEIPVVASGPLMNSQGQPIDEELFDDRYVTVVGTAHQLNIRAFEDQLSVDLDDDLWQPFRGGPAIIATHVLLTPAFPATLAPAGPAATGMADWVTVDDIADNPARYFGQTVRVNGEVEELDQPAPGGVWAFGLEDSDFLFDEQILVVGAGPRERMTGAAATPVDLDSRFVWVSGEVRRFTVPELEAELGVDLDDALYDEWVGKPAIVADSVRLAPMYSAPYGPYGPAYGPTGASRR